MIEQYGVPAKAAALDARLAKQSFDSPGTPQEKDSLSDIDR